MLTFLDSAHKFFVDRTAALQQRLDFGPRLFVTSLVPVSNVAAVETVLSAGGAIFGSGLIPPAVLFHAECVVLMAKDTSPQSPELDLKNKFEFGFVQGIKHLDLHLEYWGQVQGNGRSILHITMPGTFEVDTDQSIKPWSRIAASRFKITNITQAASRFNSLKVTADFSDHPLYVFNHTFTAAAADTANGVSAQQFIRSVTFKRELRTIFCFKTKASGDFTPISSTSYTIQYNHVINYTGGSATNPNVTDKVGAHQFPSGGSPSYVDAADKQILAMAKAGAPLFTPAVLKFRLSPAGSRTVTKEKSNSDFDPSFWQ